MILYFQAGFFSMSSSISSSTLKDAKKWPLNTNIQQVTTYMHSYYWTFFLNEQHQTLDSLCSTPFLSLPWSIKCITQMSGSNLGTSTSTHSPSCSAWTHFRLFLFPMPSVLCCGSAILSWGLTTVSHASWERSVYFLSLLNLWKKRASPLSCLPMTSIMLCNCIGPVSRVKRGKKITREKILKNTFRSNMLRHFPFLLWTCFTLMLPHPSSEDEDYFWTLRVTIVSPRKEIFLHKRFLSAFSSAQPAGQCKKISHIFMNKHTPPVENTFSAWVRAKKQKVVSTPPFKTPSLYKDLLSSHTIINIFTDTTMNTG